jgi:hypothetical protein
MAFTPHKHGSGHAHEPADASMDVDIGNALFAVC